MVGCVDWTNRLARRVAAMLAHHRHEAPVEVGAAVFPALVVSLDADPRHLAATQNVRAESGPVGQDLSRLPVRADCRNVVFGVARAHTRSAPSAAREIDGHRPAPLGHAAPMIWIVHALVLGLGIALLALSIVRDRRPKARKELVRRVTGHLFPALRTAVRTLARGHFRSAVLGDLRYAFCARVMARTSRSEIRDCDRLADSAPVLPRGPFSCNYLSVAARFGDGRLGRDECNSSSSI